LLGLLPKRMVPIRVQSEVVGDCIERIVQATREGRSSWYLLAMYAFAVVTVLGEIIRYFARSLKGEDVLPTTSNIPQESTPSAKPYATAGDLRAARMAGCTSGQEVREYLLRTRRWDHSTELLEQAMMNDDPEYVDRTPLIDVAASQGRMGQWELGCQDGPEDVCLRVSRCVLLADG
jgi:hypothetical protein